MHSVVDFLPLWPSLPSPSLLHTKHMYIHLRNAVHPPPPPANRQFSANPQDWLFSQANAGSARHFGRRVRRVLHRTQEAAGMGIVAAGRALTDENTEGLCGTAVRDPDKDGVDFDWVMRCRGVVCRPLSPRGERGILT